MLRLGVNSIKDNSSSKKIIFFPRHLTSVWHIIYFSKLDLHRRYFEVSDIFLTKFFFHRIDYDFWKTSLFLLFLFSQLLVIIRQTQRQFFPVFTTLRIRVIDFYFLSISIVSLGGNPII